MVVDEERNRLILEYWDQGCTQGKITKLLNARGYSITRSAVAGVVSRAGKTRGLQQNHNPVIKREKPLMKGRPIVPKSMRPQQIISIPKWVSPPENIGPTNDFPAQGFCQYIAGDLIPGWQCCGQPTESRKKSYCAYHDKRLHQQDRRTAAGRQQKAAPRELDFDDLVA